MTDNENQSAAVERIIEHNTADNEKLIEEALAKLIDEIDSAWLTGEDRSPYPSEMAHELARRGVGFRRTEVPEPSRAEMIERLRDRIEEARSAMSTAQGNEAASEVPEPSALDAVKDWVSSTGDFTAAAEPAYIKGFEDAQEIVRGLIQAHTEVPKPSAEDRTHEFANMAVIMGTDPVPSTTHAYQGNRSQDTCWVVADGEICRKPIEAHPEPQGEPSDAQVLAALNSYEAWSPEESLDMWGSDQAERMRAALRAAWEVR